MVALLCLSSWCLVIVMWLFFTMPQVCLQFVIVIFPHHTHLLFLKVILISLVKLLAMLRVGICSAIVTLSCHIYLGFSIIMKSKVVLTKCIFSVTFQYFIWFNSMLVTDNIQRQSAKSISTKSTAGLASHFVNHPLDSCWLKTTVRR